MQPHCKSGDRDWGCVTNPKLLKNHLVHNTGGFGFFGASRSATFCVTATAASHPTWARRCLSGKIWCHVVFWTSNWGTFCALCKSQKGKKESKWGLWEKRKMRMRKFSLMPRCCHIKTLVKYLFRRRWGHVKTRGSNEGNAIRILVWSKSVFFSLLCRFREPLHISCQVNTHYYKVTWGGQGLSWRDRNRTYHTISSSAALSRDLMSHLIHSPGNWSKSVQRAANLRLRPGAATCDPVNFPIRPAEPEDMILINQ